MTHLLIATKQLLETLTQWSRHTATEGEVSDVYVRLGYEFNIACRAFTAIGVETTDLGPVPDLLRSILEDTLSQEASPASLDKFLPRIRDIIINLLHGLKRKQQRLRSRQAKETGPSSVPAARQLSTGSTGSNDTGITQLLEDVPAYHSASKSSERRGGSGVTLPGDEVGVPPRTSSVQNGAMPPVRDNASSVSAETAARNSSRHTERSFPTSSSDSSIGSTAMQSIPVIPPEGSMLPVQLASPPPPPPPPKQQDALAALQRGGELERRASRRYSAYQISKHLGASPSGVPMLPPAQNSPIPNRGRDVRESMNAVRIRGSLLPGRQKSANHLGEPSPTRLTTVPRRISEESNYSSDAPTIRLSTQTQPDDSPTIKTPEDLYDHSYTDSREGDGPLMGATLKGPLPNVIDRLPMSETVQGVMERSPRFTLNQTFTRQDDADGITRPYQKAPGISVTEQSLQPEKELTLFLQYKSQIKKFVLVDGYNDLSIARLQLAFIEKFAWNTHNNGNDLPEIYIQDPVSGVRHELEDLADVKDRSVLVLNVEVLDEVKRHIDEGLGGLRRMVEGVRVVIDGQQSVIQQVSERQEDATKEMARLATSRSSPSARFTSFEKAQSNGTRSSTSSVHTSIQVSEVQTLRRDLAVVRQAYSSFVSNVKSSMAQVQINASSVKSVVIDRALPMLEGSEGRSYVNVGKKSVGEESENIVNRVDDLQDIVEDLRKDVVTRGVRPLPRQLETVSKDISLATAELKKMQEYLKREKPIWTKIWEKELELVCNDREYLTMQEELVADLEDDLDKATQTFALVEQATKQQNLQAGQNTNVTLRSTSRGLTSIGTDQGADPVKAKDGVLGEVRALQPNHETRLEAIERAEKARQKELENRREGEFKKELGSFVDEGKLKKSGGVEEAERLRKTKDERNRREAWENQQSRANGKGKEVNESSSTPRQPERSSAPDRETASPEPEFAEAQEQPVHEEGQPSDAGEHQDSAL